MRDWTQIVPYDKPATERNTRRPGRVDILRERLASRGWTLSWVVGIMSVLLFGRFLTGAPFVDGRMAPPYAVLGFAIAILYMMLSAADAEIQELHKRSKIDPRSCKRSSNDPRRAARIIASTSSCMPPNK